MSRLDGKQIRIGIPSNGDFATSSQILGLDSGLNLPDALDTLASNISQISQLTLVDHNSGASFSGVQNIVIRGGIVNTPQYGGVTASAASVTGGSSTVTIWIPAPNYVGYFSPTLGNATHTRYIANPDINGYTHTIVPGYYGVGDWDTSDLSTTRSVINSPSPITAFTANNFACFDAETTLDFYLYNHDDSILDSIIGVTINNVSSFTQNGLTVNITNFEIDADRYKASANGSIDIGYYFPNGGRFSWKVVHNNNEGMGSNNNGLSTQGVYEFTKTVPIFYDSDGIVSSANINGDVEFDELTPSIRYFSGVAYYDTMSSFGLTVSGINLLNEITIPTTKQIDIICNNIPISGTNDGFADGSKPTGSAITGWDINWNNTDLTYSKTALVNINGSYIPGFLTNNNLSSATSSITSRIYDYSLVQSKSSSSRKMLFDTSIATAATFSNNSISSENERLSTTGVISNGLASFDSVNTLPQDELQYLFGRIIYPQHDFTQFYPILNSSLNIDYTNLNGSNKTFEVYTNTSSDTTTNVSFNDYRWFVSSYGKSSSYNTSFSNGTFTLNSNFTESLLHYSEQTLSGGSEDLVILVGIDSTSTNTTPDKFLFISGDPNIYANARVQMTEFNFNSSTESSKTIRWSKGTLSVVIRKVWLFIGYKNSTNGKNLRLQNISFS
jgi:hypothetical protein